MVFIAGHVLVVDKAGYISIFFVFGKNTHVTMKVAR